MKRTHLNFAIDGLAFAAFLFLMSTGLLLRYQLPPGSGSLQGAGRGQGSDMRLVGTLWGITRHDWGTIHFWIAVFLLAVLGLHVLLHWKWIVCVVKGVHGEASGLRLGLGVACTLSLIVAASVPLVAPTAVTMRGELKANSDGAETETAVRRDLRGSMTFAEAAQAAAMSVDELIGRLKLPAETLPDERIGPTLRRHGMRMVDARRVLEQADRKAVNGTMPR
jgi:hypothetical protein